MAEILAPLRDLAQICRDGERLYRVAAARVRIPRLRAVAEELGPVRGELHREFAMLLRARGATPGGGTWYGHLRGLCSSVHARFADRDRVYVAELENIEDRLLHAMERATLQLAPDDTLAAVRRHLPAARAAHERVRHLSKGLND